MFDRGWEQKAQATGLAASTAFTGWFYFPRAVRVIGYYGVSSVAQAAHATATLDVVFNNRGTDGLGNTVIATLTNNSGQANTATRKSAAWVAKDAMELTPATRPDGTTGQYDLIAAGAVVECTITKGAGTTTGDVIAGLYGFFSN